MIRPTLSFHRRFPRRHFSSKPKASRKLRWLVGFPLCTYAGYKFFELYVNEELDTTFQRLTRTPLSLEERQKRPQLVIIGAGWGTCSLLRYLHTDKYNITIVAPHNYFTFTPLLPSVATGNLTTHSIVEPIRNLITRSTSTEDKFLEAECIGIDPDAKKIKCRDKSSIAPDVPEFDLEYDYLVVAVGTKVATFNIPGVEENTIFLKTLSDAKQLRNQVLDCLETAAMPQVSEEERRKLLHFCIVGGGPSGVEFSGELHDFIVNDAMKAYPEVVSDVKITLIEARDKLLGTFDSKLSAYVLDHFKEKNINVLLNQFVSEVTPNGVIMKHAQTKELSELSTATKVWVGGIQALPFIKQFASEKLKQTGRIMGLNVDAYLRVKNTKDIWAIGDCGFSGSPPTAQAAQQEGKFLAKVFNNHDLAAMEGSEKLHAEMDRTTGFGYNDKGAFAAIGDQKAVMQVPSWDDNHTITGSGPFAINRSLYFSKLLSTHNRYRVFASWMETILFGRDISRV